MFDTSAKRWVNGGIKAGKKKCGGAFRDAIRDKVKCMKTICPELGECLNEQSKEHPTMAQNQKVGFRDKIISESKVNALAVEPDRALVSTMKEALLSARGLSGPLDTSTYQRNVWARLEQRPPPKRLQSPTTTNIHDPCKIIEVKKLWSCYENGNETDNNDDASEGVASLDISNDEVLALALADFGDIFDTTHKSSVEENRGADSLDAIDANPFVAALGGEDFDATFVQTGEVAGNKKAVASLGEILAMAPNGDNFITVPKGSSGDHNTIADTVTDMEVLAMALSDEDDDNVDTGVGQDSQSMSYRCSQPSFCCYDSDSECDRAYREKYGPNGNTEKVLLQLAREVIDLLGEER